MRPGRLDRILYVGPPDKAGIEEILRIKTKNMSIESTLNLSELAELVSSGPPQAHHPPSPRIRLFTFFWPLLFHVTHMQLLLSARGALEQKSLRCVKKLPFLKCTETSTHPMYVL